MKRRKPPKSHPAYMAKQRFETSPLHPGNAMHAQNDMNHWLNYEIPEPTTTSKPKPVTKSASMYQLNFGRELDVKRRKRLARYTAYAAGGKLKASMRKTLSWFKVKYNAVVRGYKLG